MKAFACLLVLLLGLTVPSAAQSNQLMKELESKRGELQRQIAETEKLLTDTRKSVSSLLDGLSSLNGQIEERKRYMDRLRKDMVAVSDELNRLEAQYAALQQTLHNKQKQYEASVQYLYKNRSIENKLLFILSAKSVAQSYRRMRYVREYADYQRLQGEEVLKQQQQVNAKKQEMQQVQASKAKLLEEIERERQKLVNEETQQRRIVESLRRQQRTLRQEIEKQRREANRLNARIDRLIAESMKKKSRTESPMTERVERELTGSFSGNRGKLPMPVTGPCIIVSRYGQYNVAGLRNVKLDNKGIDIQGRPGAQARAVFKGKVAAVFKLNGLFNILIRHGSYISVYCNLTSVDVKQDEEVAIRQALGKIFSDENNDGRTILHFQLRREKEKLNPEQWIGQ
ncbi:MAG: peptidoglycan DD-metalloendopeptidase family protein [Prevotellaceae bacterium]|jgi:septal ring factor EnvC (AmiA/AmiB activator)|nr:peptidoglycan DD-metalloendopeptidase family protein [Prevotellaceae bacterium]